jgi:hypothetical protein
MVSLETYAARLSRKPPSEREAIRQRNQEIAATPDAPGWLLIAAGWTLAVLTALDVGGDPALALDQAVATSDTDVDGLEDALENVAAFERFADLSNLFGTAPVSELADLIEALPESTIATLKADLAWLVSDLAAQPDIRKLAASIAAVLETAGAGEVDEFLVIEACFAAGEVAVAEDARRGI